MTIVWYHNISNAVSGKEVSNTTTTLPIRNFQTSSIGVYQCVFIYGWTLRRNILVKGKYIQSNKYMHVGHYGVTLLCN